MLPAEQVLAVDDPAVFVRFELDMFITPDAAEWAKNEIPVVARLPEQYSIVI